MAVKTIRKWEYKGAILEVKHIKHISDAAIAAIESSRGGEMSDYLKDLSKGHHCGYTTVAKHLGNGELANFLDDYGHPDIDVHGGVTYFTDNGDTVTYGFDCAHYMDTIEKWDADAVSLECQNLTNQLRAIAGIQD